MSNSSSPTEKAGYIIVHERPLFVIPASIAGWGLDKSGSGSGSMGIVRKFTSPDGSSAIAIKKYTNLTGSDDSELRKQLIQRELDHLGCLNHPNIVRQISIYTAQNELYHISEFCGRPLNKVIEHEQYSMLFVKKWTQELLSALAHSHENNIIHRNIHPGNICIDANQKLTLLGFAKSRLQPKTTNQALTQERGQQPYMPLECLIPWAVAYDEKVDIWSVAVILCEMITGQPLFTGPRVKNSMKFIIECCGEINYNVLRKMKNEGERKQMGDFSKKRERKDFFGIVLATLQPGRGISQADVLTNEHTLRPFLDAMLQYDSEDRFSASQCLNHPFVRLA